MTTSRVIRGGRAKIFLYVCAALILTGLIACYNNTLSQLDDIRKSNEICRQQEENLSTQLQVISDYKQRLENSLKTEKAEHQQTKTDLENKLNEEKSKNEKYSSDSKLKLNSLQQNYNLLQTQHEDLKQECENTKEKQLEDINDMQTKLNEVKSLYIKLKVENEKLQDKINEIQVNKNEYDSKINHLTKENNELKREVESLKHKCSVYDTLQEPKQNLEVSSEKSFNKMSEVSPSIYHINSENKQSEANVPQIEKQEKSVLAEPNSNDFQGPLSKSITKSGVKPSQSSLKPSQASLDGARPLLIPTTVTPDSLNKRDVLGSKEKDNPKLPKGVVAVPHKKEDAGHNEPEIYDDRYHIAKESVNEPVDKVGKDDLDKENAAHEVLDAPLGQNGFEELGFAEQDHFKNAEKQSLNNKNHIDDTLDHDQGDYKEEEEDDDDDPDSLRHQPPAERN